MSNQPNDEDLALPGDEPAAGSGKNGGRSSNEQGVDLPGDEPAADNKGKGVRGG